MDFPASFNFQTRVRSMITRGLPSTVPSALAFARPAAIRALKFHMTKEKVVPRERVLKAARYLLDRPDVAVVSKLTRSTSVWLIKSWRLSSKYITEEPAV